MAKTFEQLSEEVQLLQSQGKLPVWPTDEQRIDWAYGNTAIENREVTRQMAEDAVANKPTTKR